MKKEWFDIAFNAILEASDKIMEVYSGDFHIMMKEDHSPVTVADTESNFILTEAMQKTGITVISEEQINPDFNERENEKFVWLIDPLDGTKEFIRKNPEFCINIGLIENHQPVFGIIANPIDRTIIYGGEEFGVFHSTYEDCNYLDETTRIPSSGDNDIKGLVYSRSHFSPLVSDLINGLEAMYGPMKIIKKGSALKFFDLALGNADFYPRMAPTMEWDIAAGQAIFEALGGEVLNFSNFEKLHYNKRSLYNPHFIAKRVELDIPDKFKK